MRLENYYEPFSRVNVQLPINKTLSARFGCSVTLPAIWAMRHAARDLGDASRSLTCVELIILALQFKKLFVSTAFDNSALFKHHNAI